jgi:hypothetical protein
MVARHAVHAGYTPAATLTGAADGHPRLDRASGALRRRPAPSQGQGGAGVCSSTWTTASSSPTQATCGAASAEATDGAPTPVRWLVFDAEALTHVDATGVDALTELIRSLQREGSRSCSPASRARCARPSATPGSSGLSATICIRRYGPPCRPRPRRGNRLLPPRVGSTSSRTMLIPSDPQRSPWPFGSLLLQPGTYDEAWQQAWK